MPDDETTVEGNPQGSAGGTEQSTSSTSEQKGQPLPAYVETILNRLDGVEKRISGVQKGTDKQIRNQVNGSIERILQLAGEGKTKAQIERELWIDSMMQGPESADASPGSDQAGKASSPSATIQVVDEVLQLPANDSRVTDLKLKHGNNPKAYLSEGLKLLASLGEQSESTPGEQPIAQGKSAPIKDDNPIANIDDPKALYRLAAQQMAKRATGRRRAVAS